MDQSPGFDHGHNGYGDQEITNDEKLGLVKRIDGPPVEGFQITAYVNQSKSLIPS